MDNETLQLISDEEQVRQTLQTPGWQVIERVYEEEIRDLYDLRNLKELTAEEMHKEALARDIAAKYIKGFMDRVRGLSEQSTFNHTSPEGEKELFNRKR